MDGFKRAGIKRTACIITAAALIGIAAFVLRGPHISNALKKLILPELEMMLGQKVIAQKIYVNIFPLFVEAKGVKVFDESGERILVAGRVKAYAELSGLFHKELGIRRLVVKDPEVTTYRKQAEKIYGNIKAYLEKPQENALKVKIRAVDIQNGNAALNDPDDKMGLDLKGLSSEISPGKKTRVIARMKQFNIRKEGLPAVSGNGEIELSINEDSADLKKLSLGIEGSTVKGYGKAEKGDIGFFPDVELLVSSIKRIFNLKQSGEGVIRAKGAVRNIATKPLVDIKLEGGFYLQMLMELLKVKEKVEGFADVKGVVKGPLDDLRANGSVVLKKGNLFDVEVDSLACAVSYADSKLSFTKGEGRLYGGRATVAASLHLPVVDNYTLDIAFEGVDSKPVFKLIGWDPGIGPGKVTGSLLNAGAEFNPSGVFTYRNTEPGRDVLGRVGEVSGSYGMLGNVVSLTGLKIRTGKTEIAAAGRADIKKKTIDFDGTLKTSDVTDLSSPYYSGLLGSGDFKGRITGPFDDPVLSGNLRIFNPVIGKIRAELIEADIVYRKSVLGIAKMTARNGDERYSLGGDVYFRKARELFELREPEYRLSASAKNSDFEKIAGLFYSEFRGTGKLDADFSIKGANGSVELGGSAVLENGTVYGTAVDRAGFGWIYSGEKLRLSDINAVRGKSAIAGNAVIGSDSFSYKINADKILLSDVVRRELKGDAIFRLKSEGHGTFEDPVISVEGRIIEGRLKGKPVGGGTLSANIKNRDISLQANLLNDRISVSGRGRLEKEMPWEGRINLRAGRYDSVLSSFLKDVPEDLILSMTADIDMRGDRNHIHAVSDIKQLSLSMYGYSFANEKEIRLDLNDRKLSFDRVSMRSGDAQIRIDGSLEIGRQYNLVFEGRSSLSPLKSLSSRIGVLKGDADFVLGISGDWDTPKINGGVTLSGGVLGLKDYSYRLSSISGYLYMDNDRIVLQKLSGKIGGGDADISGVLYLKKFSVRRYYVEAALRNVTASVSGDFDVNFGGELLLKGVPESQIISGDVKINRARYRERVEWKSWLLKTRKAERRKMENAEYAKTELNIRISGKDNIRVDNNVARAALSVDMLLRGTIGNPAFLGRVETKDGTVYFRNNEFRIIHASADFADPNRINPVIQISAETVIQSYKIKMNLEGHMDNFTMALSSDPVLKEMDILALMTVGHTQENIKGLEGGIGAGEATSFVTGKMQDVIEERLRTITGFDRFQIDPYVSKVTGTVEPRLTVSKRLMGEKLFVTYSSSVGSSEEQVVKLEYFLSKKASLIGVRDERGIVGADVRFRFEFK